MPATKTKAQSRKSRPKGGGIAGQKKPQPPQKAPAAQPAPTTKGRQMRLKDPIGNFKNYKQLIQQHAGHLTKLMPRDINPVRMLNTMENAWIKTYNLPLCTGVSILNALAISSCMGLHVNGFGCEGWLAAFDSIWTEEGVYDATFMAGYQGFLRLCYRDPSVASIKAACVHANDHLNWDGGTNGYVEHNWDLGADRGEIVGAWAAAEMTGANEKVIVTLSQSDIDKRRNTNKDAESLMWREFPETGYRKTALWDLMHLLPKGWELTTAIELERRYNAGDDPSDLSPLSQEGATRADGVLATLKGQGKG